MKGWRRIYFSSGATYKVVKNIPQMVGALETGNIVEFISESYSPYDGATVYLFRNTKGMEHQIFWSDDAPEPIAFFEKVLV